MKPWMVPVISHPEKPYSWLLGYWRFDADASVGREFHIERYGNIFPAIDFKYKNTPPTYLEAYRNFFSLIRPSFAVSTRMASLQLTGDEVCVQFRISDDKGDDARVPHLASYFEQMHFFPQIRTSSFQP